jgi:hypothetical protein
MEYRYGSPTVFQAVIRYFKQSYGISSSHTVFQIEYHFVWVTKYRYKVLNGDVAERI